MLSKNKIEKKLKGYVKGHLGKGYSKHAVKEVLVKHGYDESYIDKLLKRHSKLQFAKKSAIIALLLFTMSIFLFNLLPINKPQEITGAAISNIDEGCCTAICQQTSKNECYDKFVGNKKCSELEECNVGCCIDREGYCLTNYLYGNCINGYGMHTNKDCSEIVFCRNITDKSYTSRLYSIKKGAGIIALKPAADYYKSSFNIRYYLYDKADVLSVAAEIKDNKKLIDIVILYDDGFHNDGAKGDNLYGNNWLSSKINDFWGFKKLDVDIVIKYIDGTQQLISRAHSMVVLSNNKCLPISDGWGLNKNYSIIFAAQNYENLSNGWQQFETDVQNFLNSLFSIGEFLDNKDNFNIYRLEQSLSYFNIPTLIGIISNSCPDYSNKKDLVVVLDNNEDYCVSERSKVIRANPIALFYNNITNLPINNTFEDFCNYVLTPKKLADGIISFATPPTITVQTSDNIIYNTTAVNLLFTISAINYPINSSVFLDTALISSKILNEESTENINLALTNGTNAVLISIIDKNRNKAFAQLLLNASIQ